MMILSYLVSYTPCNPIPLKWLSVSTPGIVTSLPFTKTSLSGKYLSISNAKWFVKKLFIPEENDVRSLAPSPVSKNTCPLLASTVICPCGIFNKNLFWLPTYPRSVSAKSIGGELLNKEGLPI